jgi:TolB-like protein
MTGIYTFGPFRLDIAAGILFRGAEPVPLGHRAVALLHMLVEEPGSPISKDRLIESAWPGLAIEESNLTVQIAALRRVFAEESGGENWIETLPRRGYRYVGPVVAKEQHSQGAAADAQPAPALAVPDNPSLAVLPFTNMSGDPEQEYFADGVVEDIITGLSRIKWLFVIARNSSFTYKGQSVSVNQVGRELGVRYVLEGSVRKAGQRVRITGQLVEAETGVHIWAERYDRPLDDIFALQDEITLNVVGAIEPSLREAEIERVKRKRPENLDAYDLVLRALPHVFLAMPADVAKAVPLLERALTIEGDYAGAHGLLAWCHQIFFARRGYNQASHDAAIRHARAALAYGRDNATALALGGFVISITEHDRATAFEAFEQALAISPSSSFALFFGSNALAYAGEAERAIDWGSVGFGSAHSTGSTMSPITGSPSRIFSAAATTKRSMPHVVRCIPFRALAYPAACWLQPLPSSGGSRRRKRWHRKYWRWTHPSGRRNSAQPSGFQPRWPNLSPMRGLQPACLLS